MNPFGSSFRFSLGTASFFFGLIWFREFPPVLTGLATGIGIVGFRTIEARVLDGIPFSHAWMIHLPAAVFYFVFALVIEAFRVRQKLDHPFWMGLAGVAAEISGNLMELVCRNWLLESYRLSSKTFVILILFAILRSFFVVGIYIMLSLRQIRAAREQQQKRIESLLLVNSGLFVEAVFLRKSMANIEEVTRQSYELYQKLRYPTDFNESSTLALQVAQQIHELKKDSQRILAGLSRIMQTDELNMRLKLAALTDLIARTNQNYADMLKKKIHIQVACDVNLETDQIYTLLSVLNNLVTNAVEAIESEGTIGIEVSLCDGNVRFLIWNSGPIIPTEDREWIFRVGYTTKFDTRGNPSTGLGLSHVLELITLLGGSIELSCEKRTEFRVQIPTKSLLQGEEKIWG